MIRPVCLEDTQRICDIYNHYVRNTCVSFEETAVSQLDMEQRIASISRSYPFLVYEREGQVLGFAYANRWKERSAYRFTAEVTIYVDMDHIGNGIGSILLQEIICEMKHGDTHVLMAVITLPNEKSVRLHEKFGFCKSAHFIEVGFKQDHWIDVGYWQLELRHVL